MMQFTEQIQRAFKETVRSGALSGADKLPERVRELIGYSIHPPFMGHVDGLHPKRLLPAMQLP